MAFRASLLSFRAFVAESGFTAEYALTMDAATARSMTRIWSFRAFVAEAGFAITAELNPPMQSLQDSRRLQHGPRAAGR